ncbi:unnamed protein product [Protopolystoma xenopodis]|uniref:Uncharacterized protein n=1 Tax=Protopolystoma xenopodis TaxID=117903 RepID=A0A448XT07_9PLAT|nr:unnamed protein product [Protopolystoma xenopodis]
MAKLTDDADYDAGETIENVPSSLSDAGRRLRTRRMAKLTDDTDYDAGETIENVPSSLSDAGRRLRTRLQAVTGMNKA